MANADRIIELLHEAKARPAGAERERFLTAACRDDAALKEQIVSLLAADARDDDSDFLKRTDHLRRSSPPSEKPGDRIGRYKLLEQIGEGGCGVVYMAEQEEPVRRRVALKVIKLGMDTKQVIARFEAERQALALMDHPNIAKIFDAGVTESPLPASGHPLPVGRGEGQGEGTALSQPSTLNPQLSPGRPYFVMELVRGIKITDYCDQNNLTTRERLELFIQVCQAIQHAHQKGIIHRDIKPSNILVTLHDDVAVPKVIDFGIAKATTGQLTDHTVFTAFAQFIGTPAYMSPEQAQMSGLDIDTRADIYSLGVLLYELLTGHPPFDAKKLLAAGMDEMRRKIREDEPAKPSTRLTQELVAADLSPQSHPESARNVRADSRRLLQEVKGDLDWIVMKCLEKNRMRRYETANGLAMDIQRHLDNEPVGACPPSAAYRTLKFIRRHRVGVAMTGAVTLVFMVGLVVSLAGFAQARQARDRAQTAQAETLEQKLRADQGAAESHRRLVLQYLADGNRSVDAGDLLSALPWFGRALEEEQADPLRAEMHRLRLATIIQQSPKLVALCFHSKPIHFAVFNRDGSRFVTAGAEGAARVWNAGTGEAATPWLQHTGAVVMARFSPDGLWVATASQDGTARIWNATTGEPRVPPLRHTKGVRSVAFSPDGLWLLTGSEDTTAQVWEAATGQRRGPPLQHAGLVRSAEFSPDGRRLLVAARLWTWSPDGTATPSFALNGDAPVFSPDGQRVGLIYAGSSLRTFDTLTGEAIISVKIGAVSRRAIFSPDGTKIVTVGETSQIWDAATGAPITAPLRPSMLAVDGSFDPNGRWVMTAGADKAVRLWDPATGDPVAAPLTHAATVRTATFSPDGRRILTGCDDGTVRLWDLAGGESASLPVKHEGLVYRIAFHPDSQRVLTLGLDGTAVFWELATGRRIESVLTNLDSVSAADFSADGQRVAIGHRNGTVQVWNLISGAPDGLPFQQEGPIHNLEFSPDGLQLVTASGDGFACVWDLPSGNLVARMKHTGPLGHATFTADGKKVVTATDNSREGLVENRATRVRTPYRGTTTRPPQVQVWDAATGAALGPPFEIEGSVSRVAFSPDRRYLVTACSDPTATGRSSQVFVWDLALGKQVPAPLSHPSAIVDAAFSSDSKRVVTSDTEGTVRIWDPATGRSLTAPLSSAGSGRASFSPDNHLVITAGFGRGARLWDATTGEPVSPPVKPSGAIAVNLAMFSPDGQYAVLTTGDGYAHAWKIPRSNRSLADELHYAQMLAGGRVDEQEAVSLLSRAQIKTLWEELRGRYPEDFKIAPGQVLAWRKKYAANNTYRAQEHIRLGQLTEARALIAKIRLSDQLPQLAEVLDGLVKLRETIDHGSDAGRQRQIATETLRIPVDYLAKGKAPSPVTRQAEYLRTQGRLLDAEKLFEDVIALERKTSGDVSVAVAVALHGYAYFLINRANKPAAAVEHLYREELAIWEKLRRVGGNEYADTLRALVQFYEATGPSAQAAEWKKKLAEVDKAEAEKATTVPKQ